MLRLIYTVGNALLTLGSVISLGKQAKHFGKTLKKHHRPQYTKPTKRK